MLFFFSTTQTSKIMKPNDYIKIALAAAGIACLYLIALSDRYEVIGEDGYEIFDKWECRIKYYAKHIKSGEIKYVSEKELESGLYK